MLLGFSVVVDLLSAHDLFTDFVGNNKYLPKGFSVYNSYPPVDPRFL